MSHANDILTHLKRKPITAMEALGLYGCFRLAARIRDLRNLGHIINTKMVHRNNKKYAQYHLIKEKQ